VVDDNRLNRLKLARGLELQGHTVSLAEDGQEALEMVRAEPFDMVLLDIMMPEMDGYQVLEHMKDDAGLRDIPVIVISAIDEMDSIVKCINMGAEDYLPKPFDPVLLKARIDAEMEKKQLHDQKQAYLEQLQAEREKSERLLLNVLPQPIAERLKKGEEVIADKFSQVTVLFADIVDFTPLSASMPATEVVNLLNSVFTEFDRLVEQHALEKIKTVGDAYMMVGGLPTARPDHAAAVANAALDMQKLQFETNDSRPLRLRIGIHTGPVVAGVIGMQKFSYDLWGDTVNTAARMQTHSINDRIQVTAATHACLRDKYVFEERGLIPVKGKGKMHTYFLVGRRE
jgi:class 3 adenylate cyclase